MQGLRRSHRQVSVSAYTSSPRILAIVRPRWCMSGPTVSADGAVDRLPFAPHALPSNTSAPARDLPPVAAEPVPSPGPAPSKNRRRSDEFPGGAKERPFSFPDRRLARTNMRNSCCEHGRRIRAMHSAGRIVDAPPRALGRSRTRPLPPAHRNRSMPLSETPATF